MSYDRPGRLTYTTITILVLFMQCTLLHAQNTDTWLTTRPELLSKLQSPSVFDRSRKWELGLNWGGLSKASTHFFDITMIDGGNIAEDVDNAKAGSRMVLVNGPLMYDLGLALGTRIDPEIKVEAGIPNFVADSSNSGASHGFAVHKGKDCITSRSYISLTSTDRVTLSGNSNKAVLFRNEHKNVRYSSTLADGSAKSYRDPMRSGEILFVGITLRRTTQIDISSDTPVMRITVMDQQGTPLYFSYLPGNGQTSSIARLGLDTIPLLTPELDTSILYSTSQRPTFPLKRSTQHTSRSIDKPNVWTTYRDVRNESPAQVPFEISTAMLSRIMPLGSDTSAWTEIDAMLVLPAYQGGSSPIINSYPNGISRKTSNAPLALSENDFTKGTVHQLNVVVEFLGNAGIDVDNITIRTPTLRAMERELFRDTLESEALRTIDAFVRARKQKPLHILALRSPEELREDVWYAQRYLNILLNGMTLTETSYRPADRFLHVAYPIGSHISRQWDSTKTLNQQPILWMEGTASRNITFTPAPYMKYGAQASAEPWATFNIKYGLCKLHYGVDSYMCDCALSLPERKRKADYYEIGFDEHDQSFLSAIAQSSDEEYIAPWTITWKGEKETVIPGRLDMPQQLHIEHTLYNNLIQGGNRAILFDDIAWFDQLWIGASKYFRIVDTDGARYEGNTTRKMPLLYMFNNEGRPHTAEEIRLRLGIQGLLLGSSGMFMFTGGEPPGGSYSHMIRGKTALLVVDSFMDFVNRRDSLGIAPTDQDTTRTTFLAGILQDDYGQDYPSYDSTGYAYIMDDERHIAHGVLRDYTVMPSTDGVPRHRSDVLVDVSLSDISSFSTDCSPTSPYTRDEPHQIGGWDHVRRINSDGTFRINVPLEERIYIGMRSVRREIASLVSLLNRSVTLDSAADTTISWKKLLGTLRLQAWYAKGYKTHIVKRDSTSFNTYGIDITAATTYRIDEDISDRYIPERHDSAFFDITILHDSTSDPNIFYIAIQNRRTSPLYTLDNDIVFSSGTEFEYLVSNKKRHAYSQYGARMIELPLLCVSPTDNCRMQITELGATGTGQRDQTFEGRRLIDIDMTANEPFQVNLRPGECRLFRIIRRR